MNKITHVDIENILGFELNDLLWNLGLITLWIAAIITLLSGYNYMIKGMKHI